MSNNKVFGNIYDRTFEKLGQYFILKLFIIVCGTVWLNWVNQVNRSVQTLVEQIACEKRAPLIQMDHEERLNAPIMYEFGDMHERRNARRYVIPSDYIITL